MPNDALALSAAYAAGTADPVEVFETALQRAMGSDAVFTSLLPERGLREATASRARWRAGQPLSVFDGVPLAWKDAFDLTGSITTAGSATRLSAAPARQDAALVRILTRAGAVNLGKTNLSELAFSGLGLNPHFGTPCSQDIHGQARVPGGSSSGSAMAVGGGIVPIAMGTDTAGSIRVPAAFNGLVGYRSSRHRYALDGVYPLARTLDTLGPLARSVRDVIALNQLLLGQESRRMPSPAPLAGLRLRVDSACLEDARTEPAVRDNLRACLERLARAGAQIEHQPVLALADTLACIDENGWLGAAEAFALHEALLDSPAAHQLDARVRQRLNAARTWSASRVVKLYQWRDILRQAMSEELDGALLVTPTVAHVAPLLDPLQADDALFAATNLATLRLTMPGSLLDMPGVSLPSGRDGAGLATGLLLSAPCGADERLLRAALAVDAVLQSV